MAGLLATALFPVAPASAVADAPGAPGARANWLPADKAGFGGARDPASNVWFTLQGGGLSEVYYPDLSTPSVRAVNFVVTDSRDFATVDAEAEVQRVRRIDGLTYEQTSADLRRGWSLRKTFVTDPARASVAVRVEFISARPLQLYAVLDPELTNDGSDDSARTEGDALVASDAKIASAFAANPAFSRTSSGYAGVSDGLTQLRETFALTEYPLAQRGSVVQTGLTTVDGVRSRQVDLAIGFAGTGREALAGARATLRAGFGAVAAANEKGWRDYLDGLDGCRPR